MNGDANSGSRSLARLGAAVLCARWLVRTPVWLYRARLGIVFGHRLLMLEHTGRISGRRRYVVLEVIDHTQRGGYVVIAGFGNRAQWLRNVQADPHVRVYMCSRHPAAAVARRLTPPEAAQALQRYAARHPRAWRRLVPVLEATLGARIDEHGTTLPVIRLDASAVAAPDHRPPAWTR